MDMYEEETAWNESAWIDAKQNCDHFVAAYNQQISKVCTYCSAPTVPWAFCTSCGKAAPVEALVCVGTEWGYEVRKITRQMLRYEPPVARFDIIVE
jgi:hypothetical protein